MLPLTVINDVSGAKIFSVPLLLIIKSVPDKVMVFGEKENSAPNITVSFSALAFAAAIASRSEQSAASHTPSFVSAILVTV